MYLDMKRKLYELGLNATEHANALVAYWDKNLICRFANNAYITWFRMKPDDMINAMHIRQVLGPMYKKNLSRIKAVLNGEEQNFERTILLTNGQSKSARATYYPDFVNGKVEGFYVHVADISPLITENYSKTLVADDENSYLFAVEKVLLDVEKTLKSHLLKEFPGIPYLAKKHSISESKLKRDFKQKYNATIFNYYRYLQMELAHEYLTEKKYNKSQVALMFNFSNPSNFSVCYQKYLKESVGNRLIEKTEQEDRYKTFIEQAPIAIAMFDSDLHFIAASQKWTNDYNLQGKAFIGKSLYAVFESAKIRYGDTLSACLKGDINKGDGAFVDTLDGRPAWMRWDIRPWYKNDNEIGGLSILTEDITTQKLKEAEIKQLSAVFNITNEITRIGAWQRNLKTNTAIWSKVLKEILEVPADFVPELEATFEFYKEGPSRDLAEKTIKAAMKNELPFDFEAEAITAKGNLIRVRVIGYPEFVNGECEKISGIFQDLTNMANNYKKD
jgi:PAS domain S-box-containing protein